jgi:hypothetical protein
MFDTPESANFWFNVSNSILVIGALAVAIGTYGAISTAYKKEKFSDERIAANEAETKRAAAESDKANAALEIAKADIAKANAEAAKAIERGLQIQLLLDAEVKRNEWRRLRKDQYQVIAQAVANSNVKRVRVAFDEADSEASVFANDLAKAIEQGGSSVETFATGLFIGQQPVFGVLVQGAEGIDIEPIRAALVQLGIANEASVHLESFGAGAPGPSRWHSDLILYVGHKPPAR